MFLDYIIKFPLTILSTSFINSKLYLVYLSFSIFYNIANNFSFIYIYYEIISFG